MTATTYAARITYVRDGETDTRIAITEPNLVERIEWLSVRGCTDITVSRVCEMHGCTELAADVVNVAGDQRLACGNHAQADADMRARVARESRASRSRAAAGHLSAQGRYGQYR